MCDAASASFVGDAAGYCRTLARVALDACRSLPATGIAMARTSAVSRRLGALTEGVFHRPLRRRRVIGVGIAASVALAAIGALRFALAEPAARVGSPSARTENATEGQASNLPHADVLLLQVFDPQGKPLSDADVHASIWTEEKGFWANRDYHTDTSGTERM